MIPAGFNSLPDDFRCLAIETSSPVSSIAACAGGRVASGEYGSPGEQSRQVYACVRDVLRDVGLELADLSCIAFGCGPGGFTGLRVGAAVAQGLAFGAGLRVCRVSSLAVLAAAAVRRHGVTTVAACADARMGEAYVGVYSVDGERLKTVMDDRLVSPGELPLPDGGVFAAGGGWSALPRLVEANAARLNGQDTGIIPVADVLLPLAAHEFRVGRTVSPQQAVPNYVRDNVTS